MEEQKGKLIHREKRQHKFRDKIKTAVIGIVTIGTALMIFIGQFIFGYTGDTTIGAIIGINSLGFILLVIGIYVFLHINSIRDLKIYEKGIAWPYLGLTHIINKQENFTPFTKIDKVYLNPGSKKVIFEGEEKATIYKNKDITNIKKVLGILEKKIEVDRKTKYNKRS